MEADKGRLELECEKQLTLSTKGREEARKAQEELARVQDMYERAALQLSRTKEHEEKSKEELDRLSVDLEMARERYEKSQIEMRRLQSEREKHLADSERLAFELERAQSQLSKAQSASDKSQEELARMQIELEKMYEKHDRQQAELRKALAEAERLRQDAENAKDELERYTSRFGKRQETQVILMSFSKFFISFGSTFDSTRSRLNCFSEFTLLFKIIHSELKTKHADRRSGGISVIPKVKCSPISNYYYY